MKRLLTITLAATAAAANAVVFDSFTDGDFSIDLFDTQFDGRAMSASVPGGVRTTFSQILVNPFDLGANQSITSGAYSVGGDFGVETFSGITYGYDTSGIQKELNLDLSDQNAFAFDFIGTDQPLSVGVLVSSGSATDTQSITIGPSSGLKYIPFSAFSGIDFSDVDRLTFSFRTNPSGDFALNSIGAVPEPASMAALGLGVAALLRRRRK